LRKKIVFSVQLSSEVEHKLEFEKVVSVVQLLSKVELKIGLELKSN